MKGEAAFALPGDELDQAHLYIGCALLIIRYYLLDERHFAR